MKLVKAWIDSAHPVKLPATILLREQGYKGGITQLSFQKLSSLAEGKNVVKWIESRNRPSSVSTLEFSRISYVSFVTN
jgi:hypothetical protein